MNSELDQAVALLARLQELMVHAHYAGFDEHYQVAMQALDSRLIQFAQDNDRQVLGLQKR